MQEVPVLVVGAGPVGLSASLLLSRQGVRSLLVERHPGTSVHPKARGLNVRTLELFRLWGLEAAVRSAASELDRAVDVVWAPTLIAPETKRAPYGGARERLGDDSPCTSAGCPQDRLEPSLLEAARSYGLGEFRFGQELTALRQDADGVTARVVDRQSGEETVVRAAYLVAADGARSSVRSMLGIVLDETPAAPHRMGIYFRADLGEIASSRPALLYFVSPPEGAGVIAAVNLADRWLYMAPFRPQQGERVEDFDEARCVQLVRSAVGIEDLQVELLAALPWSLAAAVAGRFRAGRVFLAGDAAHLGSQGLNVGIQDVHNLAWKLAAVLAGWAGENLLASYEAERRPFALAMKDDHERNLAAGGTGERLEQFSNRGRVLGVSYQSSAVISDGTDLPEVANRSSTTRRRRGPAAAPHTCGSGPTANASPRSTSTTPASRCSQADTAPAGRAPPSRPIPSWPSRSHATLSAPTGPSSTATTSGPTCTASSTTGPSSSAQTDTSLVASPHSETTPHPKR